MKTTLILFTIVFFAASCTNRKKVITSYTDYAEFLSPAMLASNNSKEEEFKFWTDRLSKNKKDETSLLKLAGLFADRFKTSGIVQDIIWSDSLYTAVLKNTPEGNVDIYHSLATNAITQHKFRLASTYAEQALALKDKKAASLLIIADVALELGDYAKATRTLKQFTNKHAFAYLIREAKVKDHEGKLDTAILLMERAYERIKGNKTLAQWTLSNLADMYGHAGRIDKAYQTYLTVLKNNPNDDYALKGIAWVALSNDHNTTDSKTIMTTLASQKRMPEAYLMLAEIAEVEGNEIEKMRNLRKFKDLVSLPAYKTMYHKYLAILSAEEFQNPEACLAIAKVEIENRPTPQSYDLLAWGYYNQKNFEKALEVAVDKVEHQTFEPEAYYHLGMIYLATGNKVQARYYLEEALSSEFELGPSICEKIKETVSTL
jgi:tetratricopeptide (TPR) repeat protein